jgi:hypothetical protein
METCLGEESGLGVFYIIKGDDEIILIVLVPVIFRRGDRCNRIRKTSVLSIWRILETLSTMCHLLQRRMVWCQYRLIVMRQPHHSTCTLTRDNLKLDTSVLEAIGAIYSSQMDIFDNMKFS